VANVLEPKTPRVVNDQLDALKVAQKSVEDLQQQLETTKKAISESFTDCVIVFVDLVDSTSFKLANPEPTWILRVKIFVDVISEYAKQLGGEVVKVIGDEVMLTFNRSEQNNDALNFVMRVQEIEGVLRKATGHPTEIKIALDGGKVCFLNYEGNKVADPQGTPVDRCARISKFCSPGTVLTSESQFLKFDHKDLWSFVGKPNLKGIGPTSVYQLGKPTVEAIDQKTLTLYEFNRLSNLDAENKQLKEKNRQLQEQLREAGKHPEPAAVDGLAESDAWTEIDQTIKALNSLIDGAKSNSTQYARFLFLSQIGEGEKYSSYNGKTFDDAIEAGLVHSENENGWFTLKPENKRNHQALLKLEELEKQLTEYKDLYGEINENELFEHSVSDPEFWEKYIGYNVM